jgi:hypothetical protein
VYVTTNFDPLLERALKENRAHAAAGGDALAPPAGARDAADAGASREATAKAPLVYHAFGAFGGRRRHGLVLTEDDYFDFLITTASDRLMPSEVESALVDNSLLFLGFRLTDWQLPRAVPPDDEPARPRAAEELLPRRGAARPGPADDADVEGCGPTWPSTSASRPTSTSSGAARRSS